MFNLLGEFSNRELEKSYQDDRWPALRRRMRLIFLLTGSIYAAAAVCDFSLLKGQDLTIMVMTRFVVFAIGLASIPFTTKSFGSVRGLGWGTGLYTSALMLGEVTELILKPDILANANIPTCSFMVLTFYMLQPPTILIPLISGLGGSILYLSAQAMFTPVTVPTFWGTMLTLMVANGFGLYHWMRFGMSQRNEFQALRRLRVLAERDSLTHIYNRRKVLDLGKRELRRSQRFGDPLCVLIMDLDHFKRVNDSFGHDVGDKVLIEVVDRFRAELRDVDIFGRIGGEEFVVFLPMANQQQGLLVAERVRNAVSATPIIVDGHEMTITVSIGLAQKYDTGDESLSEMMRRADQLLFVAKDKGRNAVSATHEVDPDFAAEPVSQSI